LVLGAFTVGTTLFWGRALLAIYYGLDPPLHVGDDAAVETGPRRQRTVSSGWIMDVSINGAKYMLLDNRWVPGPARPRHFNRPKEDGRIGVLELPKVEPEPLTAPPCPAGSCSGINWYCRLNASAYD
jgi:hypothetical protein